MSSTISPPRNQPFGTLGYEIKRDVWTRDLDAKIIVTSHNSRPGLSKTTLAIKMARDFDRNAWNAEDKAFMDANEYHNGYEDLKSYSSMLFDEIEGEADNRRAMSNKNVELSQAWAQNRYRNMVTICTLPSVSMLDNRMLEMSDYWINVMDRGVAHPYKVYVNDFDGTINRVRMDNRSAVIQYKDLPDGDEDYEYLNEMKHERRTSVGKQYYSEDEHKEAVEKAVEGAEREFRNEVIEELYRDTPLSAKEIGEFDWCDIKSASVSNSVREVEKETDDKMYRDILISELYDKTDMSQTDISSTEWCDVSQSQVGKIISN